MQISPAVEDYTKAIYALQERGDGCAVTTNALAERLGVTPASASAMVKKLAGMGLVSHVRYRGVQLTAKGSAIALEVIRHHRLLEAYLSESLGVPGDRFEVIDKQPFDGPVFARFAGEVHVLGGTLARAMRVEL